MKNESRKRLGGELFPKWLQWARRLAPGVLQRSFWSPLCEYFSLKIAMISDRVCSSNVRRRERQCKHYNALTHIAARQAYSSSWCALFTITFNSEWACVCVGGEARVILSCSRRLNIDRMSGGGLGQVRVLWRATMPSRFLDPVPV
jgi:hypothetical protein